VKTPELSDRQTVLPGGVASIRLLRHIMIRYLRSVWIWTASAALVIVWAPVLAVTGLVDRMTSKEENLRLRTGRWFRRLGRMLSRVGPWNIRITGAENIAANRVYVIVSNHQSLADIPLISHLRPDTKWLAKAELFRVPLVGWMMRMAGDVPVDRSAPKQGARAMLRCAKYLRQGCSVVFFPEGGRSPDGEVQPFNEGAFQLALREQVPILPLVVEGTGKALPAKSWLWGSSRDIQLRVLEPVSVEGRGVKESAALRDAVRRKIADELTRLRGGHPSGHQPPERQAAREKDFESRYAG
jgi:1-acyl-sn-glycerol-3-phosphate acyltransferase